jgi:iron complex outermembrane recepter protein
MEKFARGGLITQQSTGRVGLNIAGGFLLSASITFAQETSPAPQTPDRSGVTIEEVIVTGSNIPTSEEVGPNPVDTYRTEDITRLGVRTATDFIQKLPAVSGASINENSTNGGDGRAEINLRGILAKETLVLQDGRRLAPVGFAGNTVDLNTIPLRLIDHVDILKDGASAIYGADAVDGVFNAWLIHKFRGVEVYTSYGNTNLGFANDAGEERSYLLAGTGNDRTEIVVYAEYYNRAAIFSRDADISSQANNSRWGGSNPGSGFFPGHVEFYVFDPSLAGGAKTPTPHSQVNLPRDLSTLPPIVGQYRSLRFPEDFLNTAVLTPAIAAVDREYVYGSLDRKIFNKYLELFADFKYARTFWDGALAAAPFIPDVWTDVDNPVPGGFNNGLSGGRGTGGLSVPLQNPFNPFTVPDYVSPGGVDPRFPQSQVSAAPPGTKFTTGIFYRALEAGPRTDKITTDNYELTGGLKGNLGEFGDYFKTWNWEAGFRYNEDDRVERFGGIVNTNELRLALLDTNPATAFNPFGIKQNTQAALDRVFTTTERHGRTSLTLEDLKVNGDLFPLPAGPVSFALGGEHRTETARDAPDALTASGQTIGSTNFAPTNASREVWSIYWEFRLPVTSPAWHFPGLYSLELDYQERFENFSDVGATERPKFSVRWQPIGSALTIRATYSEAYHAPTLNDLFAGTLFSNGAPVTVIDPRSPLPPPQNRADVFTSTSGNPNLKPETAYEWTYGAVVTPGKWWTPLEGLTLLADFYHIDIRGVTVQLDPQFLVNHENEFPGQVKRGPGNPFGPITFLFLNEQNLGRFIQEGWDYEVAYTFDTTRLGRGDFGKLTATFNGTYIDRAVLQAVPGGPEKEVVGKFGGGFLGQQAGGSFTHNRWYASLFYDGPAGSAFGGLDTGFTVHYIGQYWDIKDFTPHGQGRKIREWVTLDWLLNYTFNFTAPAGQSEVPGYATDGSKNGKVTEGKDKNVMPVSTAEYKAGGWRAWLKGTTITLGINNVFDFAPPFVAAAAENNYDESTANIKGRTWYVALKKRF